LIRAGFGEPRVDSQESFFMSFAAETLAAITTPRQAASARESAC